MFAAVIQARLGSHRCKGKMIRPFAGTTLIDIALEKFSKPSSEFNFYLAAYEPELTQLAKKYNCKLIQRDLRSAQGEDILDVMNYFHNVDEEYGIFINSCHPFLRKETIEDAIRVFKAKGCISMTSVSKSHTWYYKLDGTPINYLDTTVINTKTTEPVWQVAHAFHIFNRKRFLEHGYFWTNQPLDPYFYEIDELQCVDVDTETDFLKAEAMVKTLGLKN